MSVVGMIGHLPLLLKLGRHLLRSIFLKPTKPACVTVPSAGGSKVSRGLGDLTVCLPPRVKPVLILLKRGWNWSVSELRRCKIRFRLDLGLYLCDHGFLSVGLFTGEV